MTNWSATLQELGPRGFANYAASRFAALVPGVAFYSYRLVAVPQSGMPDLPLGYAIAELDAAALAHHAEALELPLSAIRHRMEQGMTCLAAMRGARLVGVNFVTASDFEEDEVAVRFVPPAGAAWDTGLYICREARGSRAFAALWAATGAWLADRGLGWSMSRIAEYNLPSISAHARMGAVTVGTFRALRIGHRQWLFGAGTTIYPNLP